MSAPSIITPEALRQRGFVLRLFIGCGAAASVYAAEAPGGVPAAVKIIPLARAHLAERELRALEVTKLHRHVHLLRVFQFFRDEANLYVVTDLADRNLRDWAAQTYWRFGRRVPADALYVYAAQVASALDFFARHKVAHRDVKPDNVLLLGDSDALLADPGLARQVEWGVCATAAGTPAYMAPEVWAGSPTFRSDQYALAVSLVELLTGKLPFDARSWDLLLDAHRYEEPAFGAIGECQKEVLSRALAKRPADRYPSCGSFALDLRAALLADGPAAEVCDELTDEPVPDTRLSLGGR